MLLLNAMFFFYLGIKYTNLVSLISKLNRVTAITIKRTMYSVKEFNW